VYTGLALVTALQLSLLAGSTVLTVGVPSRPGLKLPPNLIRVPLTRQATNFTCGAASVQSLLGYLGHDFGEAELSRKLKSNSQIGTAYRQIEQLAKAMGYSVSVHKDMSLADLKGQLDKRQPVICLLQAWNEHPVDYKEDWNDGHYALAVGYDEKNIFFMDPSTLGNYTYIPEGEFLDRWHDTDGKEKLSHFGMVISIPDGNSSYSPDLAKFME